MFVGKETEELVFDDGAANTAANQVMVQFGNLVIGWNVLVLLKEEGGCVDPVRAAPEVGAPVN